MSIVLVEFYNWQTNFSLSVTDLELSVVPLLRDPSVKSWNLLNVFMANTTLLPIQTENPDKAKEGKDVTVASDQPLYQLMRKNCPATFSHEVKGKEGEKWQ